MECNLKDGIKNDLQSDRVGDYLSEEFPQMITCLNSADKMGIKSSREEG